LRNKNIHSYDGVDKYEKARENSGKLKEMYGKEYIAIKNARRDPRIGLALSGGGIRSASFAIGVLQGLHEIGVLNKIGYISSVSGGGYAASWYVAHNEDPELLSPGSNHLYHVSQYGHYLTSSHYSKSTSMLVWRFISHNLYLPSHLLANYLLGYNLNIGLNRYYYREGIARAFQYKYPLPAGGKVEIVKESISVYMPSEKNYKPFWIINMNLSLRDDSSHFKNRTGDAFELTPLRAGANAVGYVKTENDLKLGTLWMSPYYAVAISGAAVDSSSLVPGTSILDPINYNIGYYIDGWSNGYMEGDDCRFLNGVLYAIPMPAFSPLTGVMGKGRTANAKKYYLSDGGHFENLGVYALVRRGCRLIIISDATADRYANDWENSTGKDRALAFEDLRKLDAKLYADFGAEIKVEWSKIRIGIDTETDTGTGNVFVCRIDNLPVLRDHDCDAKDCATDDSVVIIYIKSAYDFNRGLRETTTFVDREKAKHRDFSNESTARQLYSEEKVLSYQALARKMITRSSIRRTILSEFANLK